VSRGGRTRRLAVPEAVTTNDCDTSWFGVWVAAEDEVDPERLRLLLVAALQGIATLVTSGRVQPGQVDPLIADAIFTRPALTNFA
jgi:hypothetical protein